MFATANGMVKKTAMVTTTEPSGRHHAINTQARRRAGQCAPRQAGQKVILLGRQGASFRESEVSLPVLRCTWHYAEGRRQDAWREPTIPGDLLVMTERGYGKHLHLRVSSTSGGQVLPLSR